MSIKSGHCAQDIHRHISKFPTFGDVPDSCVGSSFVTHYWNHFYSGTSYSLESSLSQCQLAMSSLIVRALTRRRTIVSPLFLASRPSFPAVSPNTRASSSFFFSTSSSLGASRHGRAKKRLLEEPEHSPTPAGPSFVSKPKSPQTQQAEGRIPWPVSNRNAFFASLGGDDESETQRASKAGVAKQTPRQALDAIVADLRELKESGNPYMTIELRDQGKEMVMRLTNKPEVSFFRVIVLGEDELGFECPSSPGFLRKYKRNEFGEWNSEGDGHNLHGLFVRDMLPHIQGMPRFASK